MLRLVSVVLILAAQLLFAQEITSENINIKVRSSNVDFKTSPEIYAEASLAIDATSNRYLVDLPTGYSFLAISSENFKLHVDNADDPVLSDGTRIGPVGAVYENGTLTYETNYFPTLLDFRINADNPSGKATLTYSFVLGVRNSSGENITIPLSKELTIDYQAPATTPTFSFDLGTDEENTYFVGKRSFKIQTDFGIPINTAGDSIVSTNISSPALKSDRDVSSLTREITIDGNFAFETNLGILNQNDLLESFFDEITFAAPKTEDFSCTIQAKVPQEALIGDGVNVIQPILSLDTTITQAIDWVNPELVILTKPNGDVWEKDEVLILNQEEITFKIKSRSEYISISNTTGFGIIKVYE